MNPILLQEFKKLAKELKAKAAALQKEAMHDPHSDYFQIHKEFNDLLNSGENRLTKSFSKKIDALSKREVLAKKAMANHNLNKAFKLQDQSIELGAALNELRNMIYHAEAKTIIRNPRPDKKSGSTTF